MARGTPGRLRHNLTLRVYGRLRVVGFYGRIETGVLRAWRKEKRPGFPEPMRVGQPYWRCYCDPELGGCGNYSVVSSWNLMRDKPPHARTCGCLRAQLQRAKLKAALSLLQMVEASQS